MSTPPIASIRLGRSAVIVNIPHAGTWLPPEIAARLTAAGLSLPDTDWHVDRLYAFAAELDVTVIAATHSRMVVDLNRGPDGAKLYPGQAETGICPHESFSGAALYAGAPPGADEVADRVGRYWRPYHDMLAQVIAQTMARHNHVRLLDAHSICGTIPRLFEGSLPDLNLGTFDGASATPELTARVATALAGNGFSTAVNGRFKGGYITRHYGRPAEAIQVLQLEMAWRAYLDEAAPAQYDPDRAAPLVHVLRRVVEALRQS